MQQLINVCVCLWEETPGTPATWRQVTLVTVCDVLAVSSSDGTLLPGVPPGGGYGVSYSRRRRQAMYRCRCPTMPSLRENGISPVKTSIRFFHYSTMLWPAGNILASLSNLLCGGYKCVMCVVPATRRLVISRTSSERACSNGDVVWLCLCYTMCIPPNKGKRKKTPNYSVILPERRKGA